MWGLQGDSRELNIMPMKSSLKISLISTFVERREGEFKESIQREGAGLSLCLFIYHSISFKVYSGKGLMLNHRGIQPHLVILILVLIKKGGFPIRIFLQCSIEFPDGDGFRG